VQFIFEVRLENLFLSLLFQALKKVASVSNCSLVRDLYRSDMHIRRVWMMIISTNTWLRRRRIATHKRSNKRSNKCSNKRSNKPSTFDNVRQETRYGKRVQYFLSLQTTTRYPIASDHDRWFSIKTMGSSCPSCKKPHMMQMTKKDVIATVMTTFCPQQKKWKNARRRCQRSRRQVKVQVHTVVHPSQGGLLDLFATRIIGGLRICSSLVGRDRSAYVGRQKIGGTYRSSNSIL